MDILEGQGTRLVRPTGNFKLKGRRHGKQLSPLEQFCPGSAPSGVKSVSIALFKAAQAWK